MLSSSKHAWGSRAPFDRLRVLCCPKTETLLRAKARMAAGCNLLPAGSRCIRLLISIPGIVFDLWLLARQPEGISCLNYNRAGAKGETGAFSPRDTL